MLQEVVGFYIIYILHRNFIKYLLVFLFKKSNRGGMSNIKVDEKTLLKRLAHFIPSLDNSDQQTKKDLIKCALYYTDNKSISLQKLKKEISTKLGINIPEDDLKNNIEKLKKDNVILENKNKYTLMPKIINKIENNISENRKLESKVLDEWIYNDIRPNYPKVKEVKYKKLKNDLVTFLKKLFLRHGSESISLIMEDEDELKEISNNLDMNSVIKSLSTKEEKIKKVELVEFPKFFVTNDNSRINYLINLVDKAFKYLTNVCDPKVIYKLTERLKGKEVYLDSSVVYRLVNLQGESRQKVIEDVVNICKSYNINLKISNQTLKELNKSLSYYAKLLKNNKIKRNLASIGYNYLKNTDNYITTYWKEKEETGISVDDFIDYYSHIDDILEDKGIIVEKEELDLSEDFENRVLDFSSKIYNFESNVKNNKNDSLIKHDAYMLALVKENRKDNVKSFLDSNLWFLTTDHFLIRLQNYDYDLKNDIPLAILPSQLLQILRFITPSEAKSYNEAFIGLFSNAFNSFDPKISSEEVQKILARISKYKNVTPRIANKVLMDNYFKRRFKKSKSKEEKNDLIHEVIIDKANEIENEYKNTQQELQEVEEKNNNLKKKVEKKEKKNQELAEVLDDYKESKKQLSAAKEKIDRQQNIISFIIVFGLTLVIIVVLVNFFDWKWGDFLPFIEKRLSNLLNYLLFILISSVSGCLFKPYVNKRLIKYFTDVSENESNNDD